MSSKAIITPRTQNLENARAALASHAEELGVEIQHQLPHGMIVRGAEAALGALEKRGFRVKILPDSELLQVGRFRINTRARTEPRLPPGLSVPQRLRATWRHHLVQLAGPPEEAWVRALEERGVEVVERVSTFGLFVMGDPEVVERLRELPFVEWTGLFQPAYRLAPNLEGLTGRIRYVNLGVYPKTELDSVKEAVTEAGGAIVNDWSQEGSFRDKYAVLVAELDSQELPTLASHPSVRWLEYQSPVLTADDERSAQIVAENLNAVAPPNTAPVTGYQASLTGLGLSGAGVVVGICDSGVDTNSNVGMHADLAGRLAFFVDQTGGVTPTDTNGHGTHVAGIAVGNGATGDTDPQGFLLGQGMAPGATFGVLNPVDTAGGPGTGPVSTFTQLMVQNGAHVMNNSWRQSGGGGYTVGARTVDQLVRDPDPGTAALDYLVIVFSAGNSGSGAGTITPPKEAKNPIVVGNSFNFRPAEGDGDDIRGLRTSSSRGPAADGRILPTIVAPGTDIISARPTVDMDPVTPGVQRPRAPYMDTAGTVHPNHYPNTGTSMAAPHVSGLCALLVEWWRNRTAGRNPSPALLKALLVNGAEDLAGGPDGAGGALANIPNNNQGWGRVSLENIVLQAPGSDRGPKIFTDQRHAFTANGQEHMIRVAPASTTRPMRITLTWTDAAGAVAASPALVNDLDLEVTELSTGNIYRGNVFNNGFSTTGGAFDSLHNTECVYVQNPSGTYEVRVIAAGITASARPDVATPWQDFALVIDNAEVPSAAPVSVVPVIDRSGSMVASGYVDITKTSSQQFVDLMSVDDKVAVVSFSSNGVVEYPTGPMPTLQTITGQPIRDAAKAEITGITFTGSTYMGDGIARARDLLTPATGSKAMVLLSDGYDNRGFVPTNPSALDVVATLPPDVAIYSCAMGPASDQVLLEQIADATSGRYYFMPTIDDLFEIYNYIRGQVTGDAIVVNESAMASSSRVGVFVDGLASEATITVAWADTRLRFVPDQARRSTDVAVRLRDPKGRLLHPNASTFRRTVGAGYVVFDIQEPLAGQWYAEVSTAGDTHVRYTVGGFVRSPIRLRLDLTPRVFVTGVPLTVRARVFDGQTALSSIRANARVIAPLASLATLQTKHRAALARIRPLAANGGDRMPPQLGKLLALRAQLLREKKPDLFAQVATDLPLRTVDLGTITTRPGVTVQPPVMGPVLPGLIRPALSLRTDLVGRFTATREAGSYNVVVKANGSAGNTRFVRQDLVSILVK